MKKMNCDFQFGEKTTFREYVFANEIETIIEIYQ